MQAPEQSHKSLKSPGKVTANEAVVADDLLPRRFGRLLLLRLVARGGMGEVYLAATRGIAGAERPCVVKIIRREHVEDRSFLARFLDEARIQAQLQHPGVAQILEADTQPSGEPYVVVEHVEGRNLGEVRSRAAQIRLRVEWPEAAALAVALAEALAHVHERTDADGRPLEIVHRDLSPQNVMVGYAGDVKLIDFGTARGENRRCHTVAGIVFAKPGYVAPEVANNTPGGIPADLYALGIMLWELVAGRRFLAGEAAEHLAAVGAGLRRPAPLADVTGVPRELDRIVARLTAVRIEDRYASARDALGELLELLKRAPALPSGERGVRARIASLMGRLWPTEPARSRSEFARLLARARELPDPEPLVTPPASPAVAPVADDAAGDGLLAGTRYRLLREIGRGAMGVVHEARHVDLGRHVALKVLPAEHAPTSTAAERFRAEARAIARLSHDNLVRLHDYGVAADGRAFYAMELLEGETLAELLEREKGMDWREAVQLAIHACRALAAAHAAGVVHRDIKPANLFITVDGTLKLLDFGVARAGAEPDEAPDATPSGLSLVGTPEYMAPEQVSGAPIDPRSDLWSLGAVLYELVTGRLPHAAPATVALLDQKLRVRPEPPRLRAPTRGIPAMLDSAIQKSLEREPEQRFQSAEEMREALEAALGEPRRVRGRRRRVALVALGIFGLALAGATGIGIARPELARRAVASAQPLLERARDLIAKKPAAEVAAVPATPAVAAAPAIDPLPAAVAAVPAVEPAPEPNPAPGEAVAALAEAPDQEVAAQDAPGELAAEPATEPTGGAAEAATKAEASEDSIDFGAAPVSGADPEAKLARDLAEAAELAQKGAKIKAFNLMRKIGKGHRKSSKALKAWSEMAAQMHAWGEAHRVAVQWAAIDKGAEARLHLARMQRSAGKSEEALQTLTDLLQDHPGCDEARELHRSMSGAQKLAAH
jgi:serine/threonine-protein kinase